MTILRVENDTAITSGVFLLPFPAVDWFKWAILGAVTEMTNPDNWVGSSSEEIDYAIRESNRMIASFKVLNFNPFPVGIILPFASDTIPDGYLLCDGASKLVASYPELFAVIGYSFGGASDNFNVPNMVTRVAIGKGGGFTFADTGGEQQHTLSTAEIPSHSHTIPTTITTLVIEPGEVTALTPIPIITSNTGDTGGGEAHNNMQPFMALTYVIYAGQ